MSLLQYTSKEMFSSTELIRKSKMVFDKLNDKDIEKAIILRDGKPSFMLLNFDMYESLIEEYMLLKEEVENKKKESKKTIKNIVRKEEIVQEPEIVEEDLIDDIDEINDEDLKEALAKIEQLDVKPKKELKDKDEHLKEFWE